MAAFYLDEDVSLRLAHLLVAHGNHVATTDEEGRKGASDARQLLFAAERGWTLLTNNGDHYRLLHDAWLVWAHEWGIMHRHAGILVLPHVVATDLARVAEAIHQFASDPATMLDASLATWTPMAGWKQWPH